MSSTEGNGGFATRVRDLLVERRTELARRWLDELLRRLPDPAPRIFPTEALLDHIPAVLARIAEAAVDDRDLLDSELVRTDMRAMARLRRNQGYDADEIVQELEILAGIVFDEVLAAAETARATPLAEGLRVARRLQVALDRMSLFTVRVFREETTSDRLDRAQMLHGFGIAVTHELRNRLHATQFTLEALRERGTEAELVARIEGTLRGIEEVVGDVFMVAVAHGRADPVAEKRQLLLDLVRAVTEDLAAYAQGEGVRLVIDEESMPNVRVDATRLQFVFVNLLSNGIKYADRAKDERWVRVRAQPWGEEQWCVEVQDNGIGIPADEREAIFDRHVRGSRHEDRPGQGLGLALARDAVEQLGGTIWVDSREGEGSTFRFLVRRPAAKLERDQK